jgi:hypothetical protein
VGIKSDHQADPDVLALKELLIYGIKGVAAMPIMPASSGKPMRQ